MMVDAGQNATHTAAMGNGVVFNDDDDGKLFYRSSFLS
jgi:hypothetical protein